MGIKNVVVIVDDFSSSYLQLLFEGYKIDTFDYGTVTSNLVAYDTAGNVTFDYGLVTENLTHRSILTHQLVSFRLGMKV